MKKVNTTVKKETVFVAIISTILSMLLQSVFLIAGKWDYTVLLGNLYGLIATVGNFLLLGITVQSSVEKNAEDAKKSIKLSQSLRMLMLFVLAAIGYLLFRKNIWAVIAVVVPYLFPRIAVTLRPIFKKY
ncbi:MAG: hypothetical protein IKK55_04195 [Clostridia bacterium]|nr:hypothetical protein [Clostridia bacterium]